MGSRSDPARFPRAPSRRDGRARVASLLDAADAVIGERGFEAATMSEIAARAGAPIGSLYRFFPGKALIGEALVQRYLVLVLETLDALRPRAAGMSPAEIAASLIDRFVPLRPRAGSVGSLLDARADGDAVRAGFRARITDAIAALLALNAPHLPAHTVRDIAVVTLTGMKLMATSPFSDAPDMSGARDELRTMVRLYLQHRLRPPGDAAG